MTVQSWDLELTSTEILKYPYRNTRGDPDQCFGLLELISPHGSIFVSL